MHDKESEVKIQVFLDYHRVDCYIITEVSTDRGASIFRVQQSKKRASSWAAEETRKETVRHVKGSNRSMDPLHFLH